MPRHACRFRLRTSLQSFAEQESHANMSPRQRISLAMRLSPSCPTVFLTAVFYGFGRNWGASDTDGQPQRRGRQATGAREGGPVALSTRSVRYGAQGTKTTTSTPTHHPTSTTSLPGPTPPTITSTCPCQPTTTPHYRCLTTHTRSWGWVVKHRPHQSTFAVGWRKPGIQGNPRLWGPVSASQTRHASRQARDTLCPCSHPFRDRLLCRRSASTINAHTCLHGLSTHE
jgi:hypothetical protein